MQYGTNVPAEVIGGGNGTTVNTTAGSGVITGVGTAWSGVLKQGTALLINDDLVPVYVYSVDSDTQVTIYGTYPSTLTGADYLAVNDFTPNMGIPLMNQGDMLGALIYTAAMQLLDALGGRVITSPTSISWVIGSVTLKIVVTATTWTVYLNDVAAGGGSTT